MAARDHLTAARPPVNWSPAGLRNVDELSLPESGDRERDGCSKQQRIGGSSRGQAGRFGKCSKKCQTERGEFIYNEIEIENNNNNNNNKMVVASRGSSTYLRLLEACKRKDLEALKALLERRPDLLKRRDKHRRTLLHYAAIRFADRHEDLEEAEAEEGAEEGDGGEEEEEEELAPAELEAANKCLECFRFLSERCGPEQAAELDSDGLSVLHLAVISCNLALVRHLTAGPSELLQPLVGLVDNERHSALHWAVITNSLRSVRLLVRRVGLELVHGPDLNGATPLHYATQTGDYPKYRRQLRSMLQASGSGEPADGGGGGGGGGREEEEEGEEGSSKPRSGSLAILKYLVRLPGVNLEVRDNDQRTPLLWAASSGNRDAILLLARAGACGSARDANQLGALHCAASHGFTDCLECLLALGQPTGSGLVDQADNLSCTPLFYAVLSSNVDCLELLLERGAQADWQDVRGRSAAHFAALKGQLNSLRLLEGRGANLWLANKQGDLPLHYAVKSGRQQVVRWLLEHSPYERAVNAINNVGRAPIHLAVQRNNQPLVDYLIRCGANLNQLAKVRDKPAELSLANDGRPTKATTTTTTKNPTHRYETALDLARRLGYEQLAELLAQHQAQPAARVLSSRRPSQTAASTGAARSLFDLQAAQVASPIGFETGSSSAEPQSEAQLGRSTSGPQAPRPPTPLEATLPLLDSSGSSAMSQSSVTSLRGLPPLGQPATGGGARTGPRQQGRHAPPLAETGHGADKAPYKGGISYHNDHINASIKCRLYGSGGATGGGTDGAQHAHSFPAPADRKRGPRGTGSQEIITNVNVYTSPCAHCAPDGHCAHCPLQTVGQIKPLDWRLEAASEPDSDASSESLYSGGGAAHLPEVSSQLQQQQQRPVVVSRQQQPPPLRYLPPSQGHEQHLPAILSAEEDRSTSAETSHEPASRQQVSPAAEEPLRFDRAQRAGRRVDRYREQVRSPVADYIHRPVEQLRSSSSSRAEQARGWPHEQQQQVSARQPLDLSHVKSKVDSHRNDSGLSSHFGDELDSSGRRSKSMSTLSSGGQQQHLHQQQQQRRRQHQPTQQMAAASSPAEAEAHSRSVSRQTIIKTRRLSVDSVELASRVEKSIWKYKQENRLFEELQRLKRSQIRSGRANEALLVKRLIEHFRNDSQDVLLGLDSYTGPYTYKSYELYLYDQLRKLSQSNCAKLAGGRATRHRMLQQQQQQQQQVPAPAEERDFLEEDLRAEMELRRVVGSPDELSTTTSTSSFVEQQVLVEPSGALEEIRVRGRSEADDLGAEQVAGRSVERESIHALDSKQSDELEEEEETSGSRIKESPPVPAPGPASISSSRRSSVEVERERLELLPLQVSGGRGESPVEAEARSLSSAIICDALGNVSRAGSPVTSRRDSAEATGSERQQVEEEEEAAGEAALPPASERRRKSVVNIGNKLEVIYHDVGIEIGPVTEGDHHEEEEEEPQVGEAAEDRQAPEPYLSEKREQVAGAGGVEWSEQSSSSVGESSETAETVVAMEAVESPEEGREAGRLPVELEPPSPTTRTEPPARRRASSPPRPSPEVTSAVVDAGQSRRASLMDRKATDGGLSGKQRRVFTGYDLDRLHSSTAGRRREQMLARSEATVAEGAAEEWEAQTGVKTVRRAPTPTTFRRRLERSRPPRGPFRVEVAPEVIEQRWAAIKKRERRRRRRVSPAGLGSEQQQVESFSHFVLIYELNKRLMGRASQQQVARWAGQLRPSSSTWWCRGKVVRLVDVRSLKRTSSLPESLIYSNDLLKRFNILKL